jgi:uncharacterized repeat protein (TIGR01451 family)
LQSDAVDNPDPTGALPPGTTAADFPAGFFRLNVRDFGVGQHITVKIGLNLHPGEAVSQYWKFGSPGLDASGNRLPDQWYPFSPYNPATDTGAEIQGNNIILHFVDGQHGDDDLSANGVIVDPSALRIVPAADLSLGMSVVPGRVSVGQNLTYTLTVTNHAVIADRGVVVTDPLPSGVAFVSASSSQGFCTLDGGTLLCHLGTLAPGASAAIRLVALATAAGPLVDTARVSGSLFDPVPGNNAATATATATAPTGSPLQRFVTTLYAEILDRAPEPKGLASWVGRLEAGARPAQVARAIFHSPEHRTLVRQHLAPRITLRHAFLDALHAEGDPVRPHRMTRK